MLLFIGLYFIHNIIYWATFTPISPLAWLLFGLLHFPLHIIKQSKKQKVNMLT